MRKRSPKRIINLFWTVLAVGALLVIYGFMREWTAAIYIGAVLFVLGFVLKRILFKCPDCGTYLGSIETKVCPHCGKQIDEA